MAPRKVPMSITYTSLGTQPPIYLAGSFSGWHPEEMEYTIDSNDEHHFKKEVMVEEGAEFQYKFRIGEGDWWALNEEAPTVTDGLGNRNNLLVVPVSAHELKELLPVEVVPIPTTIKTQTEPTSSKHDTKQTDDKSEGNEHKEDKQTEPKSWIPEDKEIQPMSESISHSMASKIESDKVSPFEDYPSKIPSSNDVNILSAPVLTSVPIYDNMGESSGSETILTPQTPLSIQDEKQEAMNEETAENPHEKTPAPIRAHTPIPEVIVEKVDDEPRHGDDFGSHATSAQQEAHKMRAQDAEPDQVIVKPEMSLESITAAEVADSAAALDKSHSESFNVVPVDKRAQIVQTQGEVAAEVADSAALVDKEKPEPLSPDKEAGRTGERRLSHTPISEVAETAAEVADSAAMIDAQEPKTTLPAEQAEHAGEGQQFQTPILETATTAPELPVAAAVFDSEDAGFPFSLTASGSNNKQFKTDARRFKLVDPDSGSPSGTATPVHERAPLFEHELPERYEEEREESQPSALDQLSQGHMIDNAEVDQNDPLLEQFPSDRLSILHTVRSCGSRLNEDETHFQGSPSSSVVGRNVLTDDQDLEDPPSALLDVPSNASAQPSPILDVITEENNADDDIVQLPAPSMTVGGQLAEKELPTGTIIAVQQMEGKIATPGKMLRAEQSSHESPPETKPFDEPSLINPPVAFSPQVEEVASLEATEPIAPKVFEPEINQREVVGPEVTQPDHFQAAIDKPQTSLPNVTSPVPSKPEVLADNTPTETTANVATSEGEPPIEESRAVNDGPEIFIQPATPGVSDINFKNGNIAKSTATENDTVEKSNLKMRNQAAIKRASTPTSIASPHKDSKTRNIFEVIWRTVFVSWIGGLITRLCSSRHRPLLALAIIVFTLAPVLYFRVI